MSTRKHIIAIFTYSKSVPVFMNDVNTFKQALTSAPGNTFVTIPPATITDLETHLTTLTDAEAEVNLGRDGAAAIRDIAWDVVKNDVRDLVRIVQQAADNAVDEATSTAIILACGLKKRKAGNFVKPDFSVKNDRVVSGMVRLASKAAARGVKAAYEWQSSPNGVTFTTFAIGTKSRITYLPGVLAGTKMYFRKRVITNKDEGPASWSQIVIIFII